MTSIPVASRVTVCVPPPLILYSTTSFSDPVMVKTASPVYHKSALAVTLTTGVGDTTTVMGL